MSAGKVLFIQVGIVAAILLCWESLVRADIIPQFFFPLPSAIGVRLWHWMGDEKVYRDAAITLIETIAAFALGTTLGIVFGIWLGLSQTAARILEPFFKAANAVPRVILAPIFMLWFGLGLGSKIVLGTTLVLFATFFNTYQGMRELNSVVLSNARMLGADRNGLLRHVYLPAAATWILSSLRVSVGFAMIGAVIGEYLGASAGLGYRIAEAEALFDGVGVFTGMVVLAAFALVLDSCVSLLERKIVVWRAPLSPQAT
jgi:NitT/TauT family transport system permease protein